MHQRSLCSPPSQGGVQGVGLLLVLVNSTSSCATTVDDERCIAVGHLEGTGVGAVAFSQGD